MSKASLAAEAYGLKEVKRLSERMALTPHQYDLFKGMFALAWMEGHKHGVIETSQAMMAALRGLEIPSP